MSITLNELYYKAKPQYEMQQLAGAKSNKKIVQWIHTLEDVVACEYLRGGELVFTTGIGHDSSDWLLSFVKILQKKEASGLVVNEGCYIEKLPSEVVTYCQQVEFPLFTIPWKTHLVDITRDFSNRIIKSEELQDSIGCALKNYIFYPEEQAKALRVLQRYGYDEAVNCHLVVLELVAKKATNQQPSTFISENQRLIENRLMAAGVKYALFSYEARLFILLFEVAKQRLVKLVNELLHLEYPQKGVPRLAISTEMQTFKEISKKYYETTRLLAIAEKKQKNVLFYEDLGIQQILLGTEESLLKKYQNQLLEPVLNHDRTHQTNYLQILEIYLGYNGSVQKVAEKLYIHRNTVNYQVKQISKLLNQDITKLEARLEVVMALKIREMF